MKPMLAATLERLEDVSFPVFVSPKLDGIRCLIHNGIAVSRQLKPIPNKHIQECLKGLPNGLDGELILGNSLDFSSIQSSIMSEEGRPNFSYVIFDSVLSAPYSQRLSIFAEYIRNHDRARYMPTYKVNSILELLEKEDMFIKSGYEGIMIRSLDSPYKFGRSTVKEGYLLKFKRFKDSEAKILDFEEKLTNNNEKLKDALGHNKRSSHKANLSAANCLGSFIVYDPKLNTTFKIGSGFTQKDRNDIWLRKDKEIGKFVTYTYQEIGPNGKPRFPIFKGFRDERDLSED